MAAAMSTITVAADAWTSVIASATAGTVGVCNRSGQVMLIRVDASLNTSHRCRDRRRRSVGAGRVSDAMRSPLPTRSRRAWPTPACLVPSPCARRERASANVVGQDFDLARGRRSGRLQRTIHMTAIAADFDDQLFAQSPPFARALEALSAIHGPARPEPHGAMGTHGATMTQRAFAPCCSRTRRSALALLRDLDRAHRSGNPKRVAKVRRRLDRVLDTIEAREH